MKVFEALQKVKDGQRDDQSAGICYNVEEILPFRSKWDTHYTECFKAWTEFSGNVFYPVSSECGGTPQEAFLRMSDAIMWNPEHPYGAARLRLLDHCINWFKERDL